MLSFDKIKNCYFFFIEGNIGAGKSTLFNNIKKYFELVFIEKVNIFYLEEPVNDWVENFVFTDDDIKINEKIEIFNGEETNYLILQYKKPTTYFSFFQTIVLLSYFKLYYNLYNRLEKLNDDIVKIIICDRSYLTMKEIFFDGLKDLYNINTKEIITYNDMYYLYFNNLKFNYFVINVNTNYQQCYLNKNKRLREGEEVIKLDFLELLERNMRMYIDNLDNDRYINYNYLNNNDFTNIIWFIINKSNINSMF